MLFLCGYIGFMILLFLTIPLLDIVLKAYFDWVDKKLEEWKKR